MYTTQFFSSGKLKFILLLRGQSAVASEAVAAWRRVSDKYKAKSIFAYMLDNNVADVLEFFGVDASKDLPIIVAHDPTSDSKYKSKTLTSLDDSHMQSFTKGVLQGTIKKIVKSEPVPAPRGKGVHVVQAVGTTVVDIVSEPGKDVLLELYAPWCAHCKKLRSTYDILGRAVAAESRIVIAKMDATANDVPSAWNVKNFPTLLWFPAKDKPYNEDTGPIPRPYWDAGLSLYEIVGFVQRESSFDMKTLKVASMEQQGQLLSEEEPLRLKYEEDDRKAKRNEDRLIYENPTMDYLFGEVTFDGKRWHMFAAAGGAVMIIVLSCVLSSRASSNNGNKMSNIKRTKSQ